MHRYCSPPDSTPTRSDAHGSIGTNMKVYALTVRNRVVALLFGLAVLGVGAALFVVGLAVLAVLALAGALLATGVAVYYRLRGRDRALRHASGRRAAGLDPALEVFSEQPDPLGPASVSRPDEE